MTKQGSQPMRALGTVIDWNPGESLGETEFYSGLLD
jgi:hypothetical protein